jgi:hypothetical protein
MSWLLLILLLLLPGGAAAAATTPADAVPAPPPFTMALDAGSPALNLRLDAPTGEYRRRLLVSPHLHAIRLRADLPPGPPGSDNFFVTVQLVALPSREGQAERPFFTGRLQRHPPPQQLRDPAWRYLHEQIRPRMREREEEWELRVSTMPVRVGDQRPPLELTLRLEADIRPLTQRERELMVWRRGIIDPVREVEAVRAKLAELSDEEIRYYTGFPSREAALKYWGRTRRSDLRGPDGALRFPSEANGLTQPGNPLPDGRYLHHDGRPPPLPE